MYLLTIRTPLIGFFLTFINQKKIKTTTIQILACIIIFFTWINRIIILYECTINDTHCQTKIINWIEIEYIRRKISLHTNTLSSSMLFIITSISLFNTTWTLSNTYEDPINHKHRFIAFIYHLSHSKNNSTTIQISSIIIFTLLRMKQ